MASLTSVGELSFPVVDLRSVDLSDRGAVETREREINELISSLNKKFLDANKELEAVRKKLSDTEARFTQAKREIRHLTREIRQVQTIEYSVREWSQVKMKQPIYARGAQIKAWDRCWYLKIEKTDTGIRCSICCDCESKDRISRDYQIFVKDRHNPGIAIVGKKFSATFRQGQAGWGYVIGTMEQLQKENAYDPKEDIVTFGVQIEIPGSVRKVGLDLMNWTEISSSDLIERVSSALKEVLHQSSANVPQVLCSLVGEYVRGDVIIT